MIVLNSYPRFWLWLWSVLVCNHSMRPYIMKAPVWLLNYIQMPSSSVNASILWSYHYSVAVLIHYYWLYWHRYSSPISGKFISFSWTSICCPGSRLFPPAPSPPPLAISPWWVPRSPLGFSPGYIPPCIPPPHLLPLFTCATSKCGQPQDFPSFCKC